jgi:hypothetical protein
MPRLVPLRSAGDARCALPFAAAMSRHDSLRASDADRDAVIHRLREAAGEGRLEPDELEQRIDVALRARTYRDLAGLLADLPGDGHVFSRRAGPRTIPIAQPAVLGAGLVVAVTLALAVVVLVVVLVLAAAAWWIAVVLIWLAFRTRGVASARGRLGATPCGRATPTALAPQAFSSGP